MTVKVHPLVSERNKNYQTKQVSKRPYNQKNYLQIHRNKLWLGDHNNRPGWNRSIVKAKGIILVPQINHHMRLLVLMNIIFLVHIRQGSLSILFILNIIRISFFCFLFFAYFFAFSRYVSIYCHCCYSLLQSSLLFNINNFVKLFFLIIELIVSIFFLTVSTIISIDNFSFLLLLFITVINLTIKLFLIIIISFMNIFWSSFLASFLLSFIPYCGGVVLQLYLDHKFHWPQEGLSCELLVYKVVT